MAFADGSMKIFNVESGIIKETINVHDCAINACIFDGNRVISACNDGSVLIWNRKEGKIVQELRGHEDWVQCLAMKNGTIVLFFAKSIVNGCMSLQARGMET